MTLVAKNLSKTFYLPEKLEILKGINFEIQPGESIAIMGSSGEGKTTLLHILGTLAKSDHGVLEILGTSIEKQNLSVLRNQKIGFIFQSYNLLEDLTVLDNVLMPARIARMPLSISSPLYQRGLFLLEHVKLKEKISIPVKLLSGGEKQRVAIARALCNDPCILLADEPSGNLDYLHSQIIHELLLQCAKELKKSVIVATHDKELASLCDKIYVLKKGKLFPITLS